MRPLRVLVTILGALLLGVIIWAIAKTGSFEDFWFEMEALTEQPWGFVSLADLYVGFVFIAIVMMLTERSFMAGALWAAPVFVLGNVWTAVWLVLRLPRLADRLTRPDWPAS